MSMQDVGPVVWDYCFEVAKTFPLIPTDSGRKTYMKLIMAPIENLPCNVCSYHFKTQLKDKLDFTSRRTLFRSLWKVRNEVNKKMNKPVFPFESAVQKYGYTESNDDSAEMNQVEMEFSKPITPNVLTFASKFWATLISIAFVLIVLLILKNKTNLFARLRN